MGKEKEFVDPLGGIDPVMEDAFSPYESDDVDFPSEQAKDNVHVDNIVKTDVEDSIQQSSKKLAVSNVEFPELEDHSDAATLEKGVFSNIPIQVSVELGRSTISLKEIYDLSEGSIIELDRLVGEPLDLVVNGQIIAQGEVVAIDNNFGLRIKSIQSLHSL